MFATSIPEDQREELIDLLQDTARLQQEHPKLAEYLAISPELPGTGDHDRDAQFELGMAYFMTTPAASDNPYWSIVSSMTSTLKGRRIVDGCSPEGTPRLAFAATVLQDVYAYAIPAPETLKWVTAFAGGQSLTDVGAGRGYWASQLARGGLTVHAYDTAPPGSSANDSFTGDGSWYPVRDSRELAITGETVLFLCWPPGWGDNMASATLAQFEAAGGSRLIYVGEQKGRKTGDDRFFAALSERWNLVETDPHFASWWNLDDRAQGWVRR